jgi:hypothetical protein
MDNHLIAKIVIFFVSLPCVLYIAYAAKVALNLNLDIFGAGHTPAKLEEISGGLIKCKWFPNSHHCPGNNHVKYSVLDASKPKKPGFLGFLRL